MIFCNESRIFISSSSRAALNRLATDVARTKADSVPFEWVISSGISKGGGDIGD